MSIADMWLLLHSMLFAPEVNLGLLAPVLVVGVLFAKAESSVKKSPRRAIILFCGGFVIGIADLYGALFIAPNYLFVAIVMWVAALALLALACTRWATSQRFMTFFCAGLMLMSGFSYLTLYTLLNPSVKLFFTLTYYLAWGLLILAFASLIWKVIKHVRAKGEPRRDKRRADRAAAKARRASATTS